MDNHQTGEKFSRIARKTSGVFGTWQYLVSSLVFVVAWAISGPFLKFSDTWQMIINTSTSIITYFMVILVQNAQNRESKALHAKLDELILMSRRSDNKLVGIQEATDKELEEIENKHKQMRDNA